MTFTTYGEKLAERMLERDPWGIVFNAKDHLISAHLAGVRKIGWFAPRPQEAYETAKAVLEAALRLIEAEQELKRYAEGEQALLP
jgi:hypothetical protein